jgi:PKHD-type hydroxylase
MPFRIDPSQRRLGMSQVVQAPAVLPIDQCKVLVDLALTLPEVEGKVGTLGVDHSQRSSIVRWVPHDTAPFTSLYEALAGAIFSLNQAYFDYELTTIEIIQFTTYLDTARGFYNWHNDSSLNPDGDIARKLSMTIQLSDPSEYEGGELEIWCDRDVFTATREQGTGILFPSPVLHRVRHVTRGRRYSLVVWASGPRFR